MASTSSEIVPTSERDYLEQDPPIRGQKYCCVSFVSPEDVIKAKEVFFFEQFMNAYSTDLRTFFESMKNAFSENSQFIDALRGLEERYSYVFNSSTLNEEFTFYKARNSDKLEGDYLEKNNFMTTIRGLKVRGSYETFKEAEIRAQVLKRMDEKFNIYIAEVGCWCPWSPNPEELENQTYSESHLNTLVKKYEENQTDKDEFFHKRKHELKEFAIKENDSRISSVVEKIEDEDIWMKNKVAKDNQAKQEADASEAEAAAKADEEAINKVVDDLIDNTVGEALEESQ